MNIKKNNLLIIYASLTFGLAFILWMAEIWEPENLVYGFFLIVLQILLMDLVIKHRESIDSMAGYLMIAPSAVFMLLIIKNVVTPLPITIVLALLMLIPIHFLDIYLKRYSFN
ncbi:MAG TPA: hypothetical protein VK108_07580 [Pseudogracilibacillus sp.]|nr:hypothetical protein [Pseudogracilibacillus sp.]